MSLYEYYNGTNGNDSKIYYGSKSLLAQGYQGNDFIWGGSQNDYIGLCRKNGRVGKPNFL